MKVYKFDWRNMIHGMIEIEEVNGTEAEEKLMQLSLNDLLARSQYESDSSLREIRFADAGHYFQSLDKDDWNELKENL